MDVETYISGSRRDSGQSIAGNVPAGALSRASRSTSSAVISAISSWVGSSLERGLKSREISTLFDGGARDRDETVLASLLRVFVDKTTRVNTSHLSVVKSCDFLEFTRVGVAAVLGQEDGNTVSSEVLDLLIPARDLEGRRITPGVVVESEEITTLISGATVHVFGHLETVGVHVGGGVSDRDLTVSTASNVLSHITGDGLDVWCSGGGGIIVDDLVTREESQGVCVVRKRVDGREDVLEVDCVVGWCGGGTVERVEGCVDIENQVDTSVCESGHACIVIGSVVDCVDTDGVDAELLELCNVSCAGGFICDRVNELGRSSRLVVDSADIESAGSLEECCNNISN